ncbi:hypothetical protein, partial [Haliangium sp. UPWRP_2]|uniref:hypothetical protein n=1 Tax=Haliangium sp. UPWRP_2 TaxID=1931276 RepID=UPI0011B29E42
MPRSRHSSAQIVRKPSAKPSAVAVEVEPRLPPLHESLVLSAATSRRLNEFQRAHVEYPPVLPTKLRTFWVPILEEDLSPVLQPGGKPLRTRLFFEVACQEYTR